MRNLRSIMIGDVVGDPGLEVLGNRLPHLIKEYDLDFVVVNGENASNGFGLTAPLLEKLFAAGADVVTSGNHVWEQREFWPFLDSEKRVLRPMNYPAGSPGRGWVKLEKPSPWGGPPITWFTVNLQGRDYMTPIDCPFKTFDAFEAALSQEASGEGSALPNEGSAAPIILVDFHAESTKEKEALAYYLDGRASVIAGTHTHVQTADERLLPKGSAYITDLGMTGVIDGVIGMDTKICINRARNQVLYRMEVAQPDLDSKIAIQGLMADFDGETRKVLSIRRLS